METNTPGCFTRVSWNAQGIQDSTGAVCHTRNDVPTAPWRRKLLPDESSSVLVSRDAHGIVCLHKNARMCLLNSSSHMSMRVRAHA